MQSHEVKVVSWNVKNKTSIADVARHLATVANGAEILCLQELLFGKNDQEAALQSLERSLGMHGEAAPAHEVRLTGSVEALATFSIDKAVEVVPPIVLSSGDPTLWPTKKSASRVCQQTAHLVPGWAEPLTVANIHLSRPFPKILDKKWNARQLREERDELVEVVIPELVARGGAMLVGDCNAEPDSPFIQAVTKELMVLDADGTTKDPRMLGSTTSESVDYIFCTEDLAGNVQILDKGPSDHSPLLATVRRR